MCLGEGEDVGYLADLVHALRLGTSDAIFSAIWIKFELNFDATWNIILVSHP